MAKAIAKPERCQGCRYCMEVCPKNAISVEKTINLKGYEPIKVDLELCVGCGACYTVCPDFVFDIIEVEEG